MTNELKLCPLCGKKAEMHHDKLGGTDIYMVKCEADGCQCQEMGVHVSESAAAAAWNSRPIEDKLNKALDIACGFIKTVCGETAELWKEYYVKKAGE